MDSFQEDDQPKIQTVSSGPHWLVTLLGVVALALVITLLGTVLYLSSAKNIKPITKSRPAPTIILPTPTPTPEPSSNSNVEQSVTIIQKPVK